ncbi:hypothetical protein SAY87_019745 [Trapa incisa]|uniref:Uncharacterized protein n=1 Tax=Trapa incisa TaxID=236973 RepID=A0AAN7K4Y7_9MYRT|nr:hypothetical protein SAY87_019745 [Trapa incisa]
MKNSQGLLKREVWAPTDKADHLLQDNYLEFVAKQIASTVCLVRMTMIAVQLRRDSKVKKDTTTDTVSCHSRYVEGTNPLTGLFSSRPDNLAQQ